MVSISWPNQISIAALVNVAKEYNVPNWPSDKFNKPLISRLKIDIKKVWPKPAKNEIKKPNKSSLGWDRKKNPMLYA